MFSTVFSSAKVVKGHFFLTYSGTSMSKDFRKNTVLIVDDAGSMRTTLRRMLMLIGIKKVVEAGDGQEAMKMLRENEIDFIICDWEMPGISGIELLEIIKTIAEYRLIPFLLISGHFSSERVTQAAEAEVDGLLGKPFVAKSLEIKITEILKRKSNPTPEKLAFEHLELLKDEKKYDIAIDFMDKALKEHPESARLFTMKGELLECKANTLDDPDGENREIKQQFMEMAEQAYLSATELSPSFVRAHNSLGRFYEKCGQQESALKSYESASEICPHNPVRVSKIGEISLETGDVDKAGKAFDTLVSIESTKKAESLQNMGDQFLKHGHTEKALEIFHRSQEDTKDPFVFNKIAIVLRKQGKFKEAISTFLQAIEVAPEDENLHFNLGRAYVDAGEKADARKCFAAALEINPDFQEAKKQLMQIGGI
ncbi:MAG: tetratricopeptide repeat protein [Nitrospinota bacterium]